jgi:hypothetical protein
MSVMFVLKRMAVASHRWRAVAKVSMVFMRVGMLVRSIVFSRSPGGHHQRGLPL